MILEIIFFVFYRAKYFVIEGYLVGIMTYWLEKGKWWSDGCTTSMSNRSLEKSESCKLVADTIQRAHA